MSTEDMLPSFATVKEASTSPAMWAVRAKAGKMGSCAAVKYSGGSSREVAGIDQKNASAMIKQANFMFWIPIIA